jgi:hypothetical protein
LSSGHEYIHVEKPLLDQLAGLGWSVVEGSKSDPAVTERDSFRGSILENRLQAALLKINPGPDGAPWLDDSRLSEVVSSLTRSEAGKLIELNERMTERIWRGALYRAYTARRWGAPRLVVWAACRRWACATAPPTWPSTPKDETNARSDEPRAWFHRCCSSLFSSSRSRFASRSVLASSARRRSSGVLCLRC